MRAKASFAFLIYKERQLLQRSNARSAETKDIANVIPEECKKDTREDIEIM